jgi:ubiquinone/menaquinone biosynthesis C-methylase UbiE
MNPREYSPEKTWNTIAESFDITRKKPWQPVLSFVSSAAPVECLVDIGCGNGRHLIPSSAHIKHVIGIDLSIKLLRITRDHIPSTSGNISLLHASALSLPLGPQSVDIVLYIASLHNIYGRKNRIQSLKEVNRILKPGGKALITVWSQHQPKFKEQLRQATQSKSMEKGDILLYWRQHKLNIPRYYHLYDEEEFIHDIQQSSLTLTECKNLQLGSTGIKDNYFAFVCKE